MTEVFTSSGLIYFLLAFIRILSVFSVSPIFTRNVPPNRVKIAFSLTFAFVIVNAIPLEGDIAIRGVLELAVECAKQVAIGAILSLVMMAFFAANMLAGQLIDIQLGFGFAHVADPTFGQVALTGRFLNVVMVLMFFLTDSHHIMFRILYETFHNIPPGSEIISPDIVEVFVRIFIDAINMGIRIAMPVTAAILVTEILLGVIMKAVPQIHFFVIGFPIKIAIGFIVTLVFIPVFCGMCDYIFADMYGGIRKIFEGMVSR